MLVFEFVSEILIFPFVDVEVFEDFFLFADPYLMKFVVSEALFHSAYRYEFTEGVWPGAALFPL